MLLLIDNYDSFVYNLARYLSELGSETRVIRNDEIDVPGIAALDPDAIIISPGPCTPREAGISIPLIQELSDSIPILGVCLGHQAIAAAFGGDIIRAPRPVHGRSSLIQHSANGLFVGLPSPLRVGRYHSLIVDEKHLPSELLITARTDDGIPMALQHRSRPLYGVQFHPESVLTQQGRQLLANFLHLCELPTNDTAISDWHEVSADAQAEAEAVPFVTW